MYSMAIETAFYTNQTNFEFCQLELFFISTLQEGVGVGEEGRHWWRMNGIRQNRPFFKMA